MKDRETMTEREKISRLKKKSIYLVGVYCLGWE